MASNLRSDHVNYLIWRYLQERGFGNSAVQLQREWGIDPQSLHFADGVKPHTLISMLQDAIMFDEATIAVEHRRNGKTAENLPVKGKRYNFIYQSKPAVDLSANDRETRDDSVFGRRYSKFGLNGATSSFDVNRVRSGPSGEDSRQWQTNGTLAGEARGSNRRRTGKDSSPDQGNDMQIDEPPPLTTLAIGDSAAVQSLEVVRPSVRTLADGRCAGADVVHINWDPSNSSNILVYGGSMWHYLELAKDESVSDDSLNLRQSQFGSDMQRYFVMAVARDSKTNKMAIAVEEGTPGKENESFIELFDNSSHHTLCASTGLVLKLQWSPSKEYLMSAWTVDEDWYIGVWDVRESEQPTFFSIPARCLMGKPISDAIWISETLILASGDGFLKVLAVNQSDDFTTLEMYQFIPTNIWWEKLCFDEHSRKVALISPVDGQVGLLETSNFRLETTEAHEGQLTALEWQPINAAIAQNSSTRILATASNDGTIKIWDAHENLHCVHTLVMRDEASTMALAFSPGGQLLAAAGEGHICVWKSEQGGKPMALWRAPDLGPKNHVNGIAPDGDDESCPVLSWSLEGLKLAYGEGDRISVIDLESFASEIS